MRRFRINTLSTKLSLLYAGLFAAVMLGVSALLFAMVEQIADSRSSNNWLPAAPSMIACGSSVPSRCRTRRNY
jgi:hypothetical protein